MASETISFRCRGELKDWLDSYAEERMMTVSMAAQQIIAERYQAQKAETESVDDSPESEEEVERSDSQNERSDSEEEERQDSEESVEEPEPDPVQEVLDLHADKWRTTREGSESNYAVERSDGKMKYYKTRKGLAARLAHDYGSEGIEISTRRIQGGEYEKYSGGFK